MVAEATTVVEGVETPGTGEDYAVVVGLTRYPGIGDLEAPERDAVAFYRWLRDPKGGNVPKDHVTFIGTRNGRFNPPPSSWADVDDARPRQDEIQKPFSKFLRRSDGARLGRRLYVYFSGHGCAVSSYLSDAALLMPNASRLEAPHVFGKFYAQYFMKAGIFDEVALFMDCCRDVFPQLNPQLPAFKNLSEITNRPLDRGFYAFATEWGKRTREKPINTRMRGIFTHTLLEGLRTADDGKGRVTSASLREHLLQKLKTLMSPQELATMPNQPAVEANYDMTFALVTSESAVTFEVPSDRVGQQALLVNDSFDEIDVRSVTEVTWTLLLRKGLYRFEVIAPDLSRRVKRFEVKGACHVRL